MKVARLTPSIKSTIWGGQKLRNYGKKTIQDNIAESWELSIHPDGLSMIDEFVYLKDVITNNELGSNCNKFTSLPCMIKFIDAQENLSVQVHPNDEYALEHENDNGKTEMWYILENEENAGIYLGFKKNYSKEKVQKYINKNKILDLLNFYKVKKGDCFFIPAGTIHAIGKGVTLIEIQENSNVTYRIYDYDRLDKNGNRRELHLDKAMQVIDFSKYKKPKQKGSLLGQCDYFTTYIRQVKLFDVIYSGYSFVCINVIEGEGTVDEYNAKKGDSFFIPAKTKCVLRGNFKYIYTSIE